MGALRTDSAAGTPGPSRVESSRKYTNLAPRGGDRAGERYDSTMAERRALTAIMATALALMLLAACGNSGNGGNTPQKVQAALRNTAKQSGVQVTLSLQASQSAFADNGSSTLTPAQEQAILDSQLAVTVQAAKGTSLANAGTGGELALALSHEGTPLAEIRIVGSTLYAQIDLDAFTSTYDLDQGQVAQFRSQLDKLGSQVAGLKALDSGKWVSIDIDLVDQFAETLGVTLPSAPQLVARIFGALFNTLAQSSSIQPIGSQQAQLTVNSQQLVSALAQAVSTTPGMSSLNQQTNNLTQRAHDAVPANKSATVNVTVGGTIISNLELPLNQFDTSHQLNGHASANFDVARSRSVSAPSGAVPINLGQLIHALQGSDAGS